jgi:rare lipoprotein A (peptidoglycan hydrolase)
MPLCAQEEERKPSPFPEKQREREAAAKRRAAASRSKAPARSESKGATGADRTDASAEGSTTGKACYFSAKAGRAATASGAVAGADELVAAHATLALGSRAMVTNLANGKSVAVRIIDRLSDSRRVISVSEAAAKRLGFYDAGIADVRVEAIAAGAASK